jgi:hypothetical protein
MIMLPTKPFACLFLGLLKLSSIHQAAGLLITSSFVAIPARVRFLRLLVS